MSYPTDSGGKRNFALYVFFALLYSVCAFSLIYLSSTRLNKNELVSGSIDTVTSAAFYENALDISRPALWIKFLHLAYGIAIIYITRSLFIYQICDLFLIICISTALPLVLDNFRYTNIMEFSPSLHLNVSKICFFSHEVITPFTLLFIPGVINYSSYYIYTLFFLSSLWFSYQGLSRYESLKDWKIVTYNDVLLCRPSNSSHAALVPIFLAVFGLIIVSGWNYRKTKSRSHYLLFVSQIIVIVSNGLIGPIPILMALFGNGIEVLWLWSIIQCLTAGRDRNHKEKDENEHESSLASDVDSTIDSERKRVYSSPSQILRLQRVPQASKVDDRDAVQVAKEEARAAILARIQAKEMALLRERVTS